MSRLVILVLLATLGGCATFSTPACSAADKARLVAQVEADYSENVAIKCAAYSSLAECPAAPELAAERDTNHKKAEASCRQ